jgi:hypothetical protein
MSVFFVRYKIVLFSKKAVYQSLQKSHFHDVIEDRITILICGFNTVKKYGVFKRPKLPFKRRLEIDLCHDTKKSLKRFRTFSDRSISQLLNYCTVQPTDPIFDSITILYNSITIILYIITIIIVSLSSIIVLLSSIIVLLSF